MPEINTTRQALVAMAKVTAGKLNELALHGYTDSDYDVLENYLTVTVGLLSADYEGVPSYLPGANEAPWCPVEVIEFLRNPAEE